MIKMVGCLEPMVNFLWRNDVRICKVFLGLYHAKGRMILAMVLSVDDGWFVQFLQQNTSSESIFFIYILTT